MFGLSPLLVALLVSLASNAALGWLWLDARDGRTEAVAERDSARGAASACSDATDDLRRLADQRAAEAKAARETAAKAARNAQGRAQTILATPARVPGDDCRSAAAQVDEWLSTRGAK